MFGNDKSKNQKSNGNGKSNGSAPSSGGVNTIDSNTTITGDLEAGGDIRIDGKLIGNLSCSAKLIIGPKGRIEGDVKCSNAVIQGAFQGTLLVRDMLNLHETAKVSGDVRAKKMAVSAGCEIDGTCMVTGSKEPQPASKSNKNDKGGNPLKNKQGAPAGAKA